MKGYSTFGLREILIWKTELTRWKGIVSWVWSEKEISSNNAYIQYITKSQIGKSIICSFGLNLSKHAEA